MLVIRRRVGETIVIGDDIEVTVMEISPSRVKLAVGAPREVSVVRKEAAAVAIENRRAAGFVARGGVDDLLRILHHQSAALSAISPADSVTEK